MGQAATKEEAKDDSKEDTKDNSADHPDNVKLEHGGWKDIKDMKRGYVSRFNLQFFFTSIMLI